MVAVRAGFEPLLVKELRELLSGRALWTMLLILCPLVGFSFFQAVSLYGEASAAAQDSPVLASGLAPRSTSPAWSWRSVRRQRPLVCWWR